MQNSERAALAQTIAAKLRELRARKGVGQDEVAREIGVHGSAVSRWECALRCPPTNDLLSLARYYEVSVDELVGRKEQPTMPGAALLSEGFLRRLELAETADEFDRMLRDGGPIWHPVDDGARIVPMAEAIHRVREVAEKFPASTMAGRLFRPGSSVG